MNDVRHTICGGVPEVDKDDCMNGKFEEDNSLALVHSVNRDSTNLTIGQDFNCMDY